MGEARTVLYKRKIELERIIENYEGKEIQSLKDLQIIRDNLLLRKRMLREINGVYKALG